jgi:flagellin-like protein
MELKALLNPDEKAVSPVIGVILMVAITVILAAVIGTFVLGLGDSVQDTAPQTQFSFDYTQNTSQSGTDLYQTDDPSGGPLTIAHDGGDTVDGTRLSVNDDDGASVSPFTGSVSAGTTVEPAVGSDDTVRVVWANDEDENFATIWKWLAPDA